MEPSRLIISAHFLLLVWEYRHETHLIKVFFYNLSQWCVHVFRLSAALIQQDRQEVEPMNTCNYSCVIRPRAKCSLYLFSFKTKSRWQLAEVDFYPVGKKQKGNRIHTSFSRINPLSVIVEKYISKLCLNSDLVILLPLQHKNCMSMEGTDISEEYLHLTETKTGLTNFPFI